MMHCTGTLVTSNIVHSRAIVSLAKTPTIPKTPCWQATYIAPVQTLDARTKGVLAYDGPRNACVAVGVGWSIRGATTQRSRI